MKDIKDGRVDDYFACFDNSAGSNNGKNGLPINRAS